MYDTCLNFSPKPEMKAQVTKGTVDRYTLFPVDLRKRTEKVRVVFSGETQLKEHTIDDLSPQLTDASVLFGYNNQHSRQETVAWVKEYLYDDFRGIQPEHFMTLVNEHLMPLLKDAARSQFGISSMIVDNKNIAQLFGQHKIFKHQMNFGHNFYSPEGLESAFRNIKEIYNLVDDFIKKSFAEEDYFQVDWALSYVEDYFMIRNIKSIDDLKDLPSVDDVKRALSDKRENKITLKGELIKTLDARIKVFKERLENIDAEFYMNYPRFVKMVNELTFELKSSVRGKTASDDGEGDAVGVDTMLLAILYALNPSYMMIPVQFNVAYEDLIQLLEPHVQQTSMISKMLFKQSSHADRWRCRSAKKGKARSMPRQLSQRLIDVLFVHFSTLGSTDMNDTKLAGEARVRYELIILKQIIHLLSKKFDSHIFSVR